MWGASYVGTVEGPKGLRMWTGRQEIQEGGADIYICHSSVMCNCGEGPCYGVTAQIHSSPPGQLLGRPFFVLSSGTTRMSLPLPRP